MEAVRLATLLGLHAQLEARFATTVTIECVHLRYTVQQVPTQPSGEGLLSAEAILDHVDGVSQPLNRVVADVEADGVESHRILHHGEQQGVGL